METNYLLHAIAALTPGKQLQIPIVHRLSESASYMDIMEGTIPIDGDELFASRHCRFNAREIAPDTYCIEAE
jgi:hypothetical protein